MKPRILQLEDITPTAHLWYDIWHETQAPYVPDALIKRRTFEEFEGRVRAMVVNGDTLRVIGPIGGPLGLCAIKPTEMYQLFVAPQGRGTGAAAALLADAEARLIAGGCTRAHLDCLDENEPAQRFYTRQGWVPTGVQITTLDTAEGPFDLPCMIFEKELTTHAT